MCDRTSPDAAAVPSRGRMWARVGRMLVVVMAALGLFSANAPSCCTLDQAHHVHHHHAAAGTPCPDDDDGGGCGDLPHHSECCDEAVALWARTVDGYDPLHATAATVVVLPVAPRLPSRPAPPPSLRVPCGGDRVALCVLRI
ncbi:hypothetical protein ACQP1V_34365 [Microtetraspora malaysiensis]|uniref:hypothetical protein n=1 Tax=Microtetraspora malaysiensis TaxID=161358 RepID=UPI003D9225DC